MQDLTPEQQAILDSHDANIEKSNAGKDFAEETRIQLAISAEKEARFALLLMQRLSAYDSRSALGSQTVRSLGSFEAWGREFRKEIEHYQATLAVRAESTPESNNETDEAV